MAFIGTMVVGFIVISILWGAIKGFSLSVKENGPRHQANFERSGAHLTKSKIEYLLDFIDSLDERNYILFVNNSKQAELFTIVYAGGRSRESINVEIIDNNSIEISSYQPIDYKGHLGVLQSHSVGKSMHAVLLDLQRRIRE